MVWYITEAIANQIAVSKLFASSIAYRAVGRPSASFVKDWKGSLVENSTPEDRRQGHAYSLVFAKREVMTLSSKVREDLSCRGNAIHDDTAIWNQLQGGV